MFSSAELTAPTFLVYGDDEVGARIRCDTLVAAIPKTTVVAIAVAGHCPFNERPTEFRRVVRATLTGAPDEVPAALRQEASMPLRFVPIVGEPPDTGR